MSRTVKFFTFLLISILISFSNTEPASSTENVTTGEFASIFCELVIHKCDQNDTFFKDINTSSNKKQSQQWVSPSQVLHGMVSNGARTNEQSHRPVWS